MDKSLSESDLREAVTPPNFISQRVKRRRCGDYDTDLETFKEDMKSMIKSLMSEQEKELKKINPTLQDIQKTNQNIECSISFLSAQNEELKKKLEQLEIQSRKDREYIAMLEEKLEDSQRHNRKTSIEIKNVPKLANETRDDLIKYVTTLSKNITCEVTKSDIRDIYRTPSKKDNKNTTIVIDLNSTMLKTDFLKMTKSFNIKHKEKLRAKHLGLTSNEDTPVYIAEHLTPKAARLFFLARDLAKTKQYKFCWTSFGRVYIRKDENSQIISFKHEDHIHRLQQAA